MNKGVLEGVVADFVIPAGIVWEYLGATAPPGFLLCDGSAVSRAQYPDLFRAIGTTYGIGNGNTTFNLPDRRGRIGVGQDAGQSEFVSRGTTGGSKSSTASHTHDMGNHTHARTAGGASADTGGWTGPGGAYSVGWTGTAQSNSGDHAHSCRTTTLGGGSGDGLQGWAAGDAHNGLQTTDRGGQLLFGGVVGGVCLTNNNSVYADHDHGLENHRHDLEGHTHAIGGHSHGDSFAAASPSDTADASVTQATNGNLQPYIVVNYIIKV